MYLTNTRKAILLDTQIFLWLIHDNRRLSDKYRQEIQNPNNEKFLSVVSIWECVIKYQIEKLNFPSSPEIYLPFQRREHLIKTLTIDENSIAQLMGASQLCKNKNTSERKEYHSDKHIDVSRLVVHFLDSIALQKFLTDDLFV